MYRFIFFNLIENVLKYRPRSSVLARQNEVDLPRLGVSIRKRDYKLAVERNRLKRRIKNSFRLNLNKLPCYDFVVMVSAGESLGNKNKLDALWEGCKKEIL